MEKKRGPGTTWMPAFGGLVGKEDKVSFITVRSVLICLYSVWSLCLVNMQMTRNQHEPALFLWLPPQVWASLLGVRFLSYTKRPLWSQPLPSLQGLVRSVKMELNSATKIYIHMPAIFSVFKNSPDMVFQALRNTNNAHGIRIIIHIINKHFWVMFWVSA